MSYASGPGQRTCRIPDGKLKICTGMGGFSLIVYSLKWSWPIPPHPHGLKSSLSLKGFEASPKMRYHCKPAPPHQRCPGAAAGKAGAQRGASKKLQPAVYQRRYPTWVLFSNPALTHPLSGISFLFQGLGLFQGPWSLSTFSNEMYFYSGSKFSECLHRRDSVVGSSKAPCCYSRGLWVPDARTLYWGQVRPGWREPAQCPPSLVSLIGTIDLRWGSMVFFFFP